MKNILKAFFLGILSAVISSVGHAAEHLINVGETELSDKLKSASAQIQEVHDAVSAAPTEEELQAAVDQGAQAATDETKKLEGEAESAVGDQAAC